MSDWSFGAKSADALPWPKRPDGDPEEAVFLTSCADFAAFEEVTISHLRAYSIPVVTRYPETGGFGKVYLGFSGYGVDLYVPASRLEEAKLLLEPAEDTGDMPEDEEE